MGAMGVVPNVRRHQLLTTAGYDLELCALSSGGEQLDSVAKDLINHNLVMKIMVYDSKNITTWAI